MTDIQISPERLINRLVLFRYRCALDTDANEKVLKIYLPMLCNLMQKFADSQVKISSRKQYGFNFLPLEYNFFIYAIGLLLLTAYKWTTIDTVVIMGLVLILWHFVICFIKLEFLKIIIQRWLDEDHAIEKPDKGVAKD
jgi:hypothetical protein